MAKTKKLRSDSIQAAVKVGYNLQSAAMDLVWPSIIPAALNDIDRESEVTTFEAILATRQPSDWKPYDILNVARLSSHIATQIKDEDTLKRSGSLIRSPNNPKHFLTNPLLNAVATRNAIINQLSKQLGLSVPAMDIAVLANSAKTANEVKKNGNVFSLLARPN